MYGRNLLLLYYSLIRSVLEYGYCLQVGLNDNLNGKLEKIQKRVNRIIFGAAFLISNSDTLKTVELLTLLSFLSKHRVILIIACITFYL